MSDHISIRREKGGFLAELRDDAGEVWRSAAPMPLRELMEELAARGCSQQAIGDALAEADPTWQEQLGAR